jgi:hypothetical protein
MRGVHVEIDVQDGHDHGNDNRDCVIVVHGNLRCLCGFSTWQIAKRADANAPRNNSIYNFWIFVRAMRCWKPVGLTPTIHPYLAIFYFFIYERRICSHGGFSARYHRRSTDPCVKFPGWGGRFVPATSKIYIDIPVATTPNNDAGNATGSMVSAMYFVDGLARRKEIEFTANPLSRNGFLCKETLLAQWFLQSVLRVTMIA